MLGVGSSIVNCPAQVRTSCSFESSWGKGVLTCSLVGLPPGTVTIGLSENGVGLGQVGVATPGLSSIGVLWVAECFLVWLLSGMWILGDIGFGFLGFAEAAGVGVSFLCPVCVAEGGSVVIVDLSGFSLEVFSGF